MRYHIPCFCPSVICSTWNNKVKAINLDRTDGAGPKKNRYKVESKAAARKQQHQSPLLSSAKAKDRFMECMAH